MTSSYPSWNCLILCVSGTNILCSSSIWIYSSRFSWYFCVDVKRCSFLIPHQSLMSYHFLVQNPNSQALFLVICWCVANHLKLHGKEQLFFKAHGFCRSEIQTRCSKNSLFLLSYLEPWRLKWLGLTLTSAG